MRSTAAALLVMSSGWVLAGAASAQVAGARVVPIIAGGDPVPGRDNTVFNIVSVDCGSACTLALHVTTGVAFNSLDVLLAGCADSLEVVAMGNTRYPGLPGNAVLSPRSITGFAVASDGGMVWNGGVTTGIDEEYPAIFAADLGSGPRMLAMAGQTATEHGAGWRWRSIGPVVRSAGPAMWYATASEVSPGTRTVTSLYSPGSVRARIGDVVAGTREAQVASFMATAPVCRGDGFAGPWTLRRESATFATATTGVPVRPLLAGDGPLAGFEPAVRLAAVTGMGGDDFGETVMVGVVAGPGVTAENASVLWRWRGDSPEVTMRGGEALPGGNGARVLAFEHAVINANGDIIASVTLTGPGVTESDDTAVFLISRWGQKTLVAREGAMVGASGDRYDHLSFNAESGSWTGCSNAAGRVLLIGPVVIDDAGDTRPAAILWSPAGGATILAREGGPANVRGRELTYLQLRAPSLGDGTGMNLTGGQDGLRTLLDDRNRAYFIAATTAGALLPETVFRAALTAETCPADYNADGFIDWQDASAYAEAFERGTDSAEMNGDGFLDFFDYDAFVAVFESGC